MRSSDFRRVYNQGSKFSSPCFAAFCVRETDNSGPRVGFTCSRALGKAVVRNRLRRRVREAVRLQLEQLNPQWSIVINPRLKAMDVPFAELEREIQRLFRRCDGPSSAS